MSPDARRGYGADARVRTLGHARRIERALIARRRRWSTRLRDFESDYLGHAADLEFDLAGVLGQVVVYGAGGVSVMALDDRTGEATTLIEETMFEAGEHGVGALADRVAAMIARAADGAP